MCNLYTSHLSFEAMRRIFAVKSKPLNLPGGVVSITDRAPIVRLAKDSEDRELVLARWSLIPHWAKEIGKAATFNARCETIETTASYRDAWKWGRRCLVPATGFFEWEGPKGGRKAVAVSVPDQEALAFAGLWARNSHIEPQPLESFTIITCQPNKQLQPIHNRMPVILPSDEWQTWLSGETEPAQAKEMLLPYVGDVNIEHTGMGMKAIKTSTSDPQQPLV